MLIQTVKITVFKDIYDLKPRFFTAENVTNRDIFLKLGSMYKYKI